MYQLYSGYCVTLQWQNILRYPEIIGNPIEMFLIHTWQYHILIV